MKIFSSMLKRIKKQIRNFESTIHDCEEHMRQGFDPLDFEELRVTLDKLRTIEWLLKDICRTEEPRRHRKANNE